MLGKASKKESAQRNITHGGIKQRNLYTCKFKDRNAKQMKSLMEPSISNSVILSIILQYSLQREKEQWLSNQPEKQPSENCKSLLGISLNEHFHSLQFKRYRVATSNEQNVTLFVFMKDSLLWKILKAQSKGKAVKLPNRSRKPTCLSWILSCKFSFCSMPSGWG